MPTAHTSQGGTIWLKECSYKNLRWYSLGGALFFLKMIEVLMYWGLLKLALFRDTLMTELKVGVQPKHDRITEKKVTWNKKINLLGDVTNVFLLEWRCPSSKQECRTWSEKNKSIVLRE